MMIDVSLRDSIADLYGSYAACIDDGRFNDWPDFFTDDCWYQVIARENHDRGLPLSIVSLKGRPMLLDRVYGISSTIFHAPYYQRHMIGQPVVNERADGLIDVIVNYTVIRTKRDMPAEILNVGRYIDTLKHEDGRLKFAQKFCVYDNDIIPNSLIYPI